MSRLLLAGLALAVAVGCDDKKSVRSDAGGRAPEAPVAAEGGQKQPAHADGAKEPATEPERKIIYTAHIELRVADLDGARGQLEALLAEVKGYVAKSDEAGRSGGVRYGTWKVRVPVGKFNDFLARVQGFGELVTKSSDAQDVTDEFVDTEARLRNLKAEEAVLNKLLQEKAQSTADLLAFRQQITQVREQVERYQARLDTLSRLTAMTTIDVLMREDKAFVPESAPSFGTTISRTFGDSVGVLESFGKSVVLTLVALAPWSPLVLVGLWLARRPLRAAAGAFRTPRSAPAIPRPAGA
ncbi:MAG: DUF4349 domain-containing protein [Zavarzinella sp.]|nr:DUF4349 domain-containing protein [Zavarzinella sp.]